MNENDNQVSQNAADNQPVFEPGIALSRGSTPVIEDNQAETPAPAQENQETQAPTPSENSESNAQETKETPAPQATQTYEEYLNELMKNTPEAPDTPNPSDEKYKTGKDDDLVNFFIDFEQSIIAKQQHEAQRQQAFQQAEKKYWGEATKKYDELATNSELRDTIQNIRIGTLQSTGKIPSPLEVADQLIGTLHNQYKQGINDANVQTKVVKSQPSNGSGKPVANVKVDYKAVQSGNQDAVVAEVEKLMQMGKI